MSKKLFSILSFSLIITCLFAETLPTRLLGIWESKDRYVFFEQNDEDEPQLVVVLKEYYGWYYDRAAEPASYSEKEARTRNIPTPRNAEHIYIQNIDTKETTNSLYGALDLKYSNWQKNTIPFFMLEDSIYLKYFVLDEREVSEENGSLMTSENQNVSYKFYRGIASSKGFMISPQSLPKDITGLIIDGEKLYDVRYWQTDMDYSTDYITYEYKDDSYTIPKHLRSCETNYSCVSGRSKKVRNSVKPFEYKSEDYIFNDNQKVFTNNEEPYLKRLADHSTFEDLMKLVKDANSRRKPDPPALFPENDLDWHWDLIDMLEKDNTIIQQVRARQKAFGPRGRD
ncbi:hypothetical protein SAMN04487977_1112 [Treponema bryantii]|uniref:Uncharacterized protein n=1 Tax=Treponema bryantii TaxID=163 RepID=A0A1H9IZ75_9SPIR|nr:hypothetical protein [Treponema bryantii]SEQ79819.1 hypothetical protein SAMN04487977_1112 [Treponema bryantii]